MFENKIFEVKTRKDIYKCIMKYPGIHFREMTRSLNMPGSTLDYHLKYLEKRGFLYKETENGYLRYYGSKKFGKNEKKLLNIIRETVPRNTILYLLIHPATTQSEMIKFAKKWNKHPSKIGYYLDKHHTTLGFHIRKLIEENVVDSFRIGNEVRYRLNNPEDILDLIIKYDKSVLADAFGRYLKHVEGLMCNTNMNQFINKLYDIFPNPYHV